MEIQAFIPAQAFRSHDAARPAPPLDGGPARQRPADRPSDRPLDRPLDRPKHRPDRPRPAAIAERLRHLVHETRKDASEVRKDLSGLETKAERLRALHHEAVETGDRKLHRLVHHLAKHLKAELREARGAAQETRDQVAFIKQVIERFKDYKDGQDHDPSGSDPIGTDPGVETIPAGELIDVSA